MCFEVLIIAERTGVNKGRNAPTYPEKLLNILLFGTSKTFSATTFLSWSVHSDTEHECEQNTSVNRPRKAVLCELRCYVHVVWIHTRTDCENAELLSGAGSRFSTTLIFCMTPANNSHTKNNVQFMHCKCIGENKKTRSLKKIVPKQKINWMCKRYHSPCCRCLNQEQEPIIRCAFVRSGVIG